jgi:hypothetical protein
MFKILRYVCITEGRVTIEESFVDFISTYEKNGSGLSIKILNKIEQDGVDTKMHKGSRTIMAPIWQEHIR